MNVNLHLSLYAAQLRQLLIEDSSYLTVGCFSSDSRNTR